MESKPTATGWKCFNSDLQCRDHQFRIGESYTVDGEIVLCRNGWHFHENSGDLFQYYENDVLKTRVCEVSAEVVIAGKDKSVCKTITVVRELTVAEISGLVNNHGYGNSDGNGFGFGSGSGYGGRGHGNGNGNGDGFGDGHGNGDVDGDGFCNGYGYGDGDGFGYGYGDGHGHGNGRGYGSGYGDGNGYGILRY